MVSRLQTILLVTTVVLLGALMVGAREDSSVFVRLDQLETKIKVLKDRVNSLESRLDTHLNTMRNSPPTRSSTGSLVGHFSARRYNQLRLGMTKDGVRDLLGPPHEINTGGYESAAKYFSGKGKRDVWFYQGSVRGDTVSAKIIFMDGVVKKMSPERLNVPVGVSPPAKSPESRRNADVKRRRPPHGTRSGPAVGSSSESLAPHFSVRRYNQLRQGMTKEQVRELLGPPHKINTGGYESAAEYFYGDGKQDVWFYRGSVRGKTVSGKVIFVDGKVERISPERLNVSTGAPPPR